MELVFFYTETMTNSQRAGEVFRQMRDMGADSVCFNIYEQDYLRWRKDVPRVLDLAAEAGLQRYVSPARLGGIFSGLMMVPSLYSFLHPNTLTQADRSRAVQAEADSPLAGYFRKVGCVNHPELRDYIRGQIRQTLDWLQPDGILFDEPKGLGLVCACEHCLRATRSGESPEEANSRFQTDFLGELCDLAKSHQEDAVTSTVTSGEEHLPRFAQLAGLDVVGVEAYWAARGKDMEWLAQWCPNSVSAIHALGKKAQVWANNWGLTEAQQAHLPEAYRIIAEAGPDQVCSFWWWRGSDNPEEVMRLTEESLRAISDAAKGRGI